MPIPSYQRKALTSFVNKNELQGLGDAFGLQSCIPQREEQPQDKTTQQPRLEPAKEAPPARGGYSKC